MTTLILLLLAAPAKDAAPAKSSAPSLPSRAAVFVLAKDDASQAAATSVEKDLTQELTASGVDLTDIETMFAPPAQENVGAKRIKEGQEAFENLDLEAAARKYEEALGWFTQHPEAASAKELSSIHLFLASVALGQGKPGIKKAKEEMERALVFDPEATLDPKLFGPDAKKHFDKSKIEVESRPTAKLTIECTPSAVATFRDAVVKDSPTVPVGRHLVTFKRPGYQSAGVLVDVLKDGGGTARVKLEAAGEYALVRTQVEAVVPASFGAIKAPPGAKTIGTAVKSRFLVLASVGATKGELEVWDAETFNVLKDVSISPEPASLKAAAAAVKSFIARPSLLTSAGPVGVEKKAGDETGPSDPVFKKWWFWAVVGGVVVAGATTAGVVAATSSSDNGPRPLNVVLAMP